MTIDELEQEITRLRGELQDRNDRADAVANRIVEVNDHHQQLSKRADELQQELRDMKKSLRFLLAKARGEEEAL